jgi:hypothetical protein
MLRMVDTRISAPNCFSASLINSLVGLLKPIEALVNDFALSLGPIETGAKSDDVEKVAHAASTKVQSNDPWREK